MKKLAARVDKITDTDRKFFERFPHRQHRVRVAGRAEIEQNALIVGEDIQRRSPGCNYYVIVKNLAPGTRLRMIVAADEDWDTELSEREARERFDVRRTPQVSQVERDMLKLSDRCGVRDA
jgi:hypothetical protein